MKWSILMIFVVMLAVSCASNDESYRKVSSEEGHHQEKEGLKRRFHYEPSRR